MRWTESIRYMLAQGATTVVELGSKDVLTGLLKRIDANARGIAVGTPEALEAEMRQLRTLLLALQPAGAGVSLEEQKRRAIAAAGRFHSGLANLSTEHDRYLVEAYRG